jgi:hypothetical protein
MVCQMNISNQSAAREYQSTYKRLATIWLQVTAKLCTDPDTCFTKESQVVTGLLNTSDPRDVAAVRGHEALARIKVPNEPFFQRFDPAPYNEAIGGLMDIQQYIYLARMRREDTAAFLIDKADKELVGMKGALDAGVPLATKQYEFPCHYIIYWESLAKAAPFAGAADDAGKEIQLLLNDAVRLDSKSQKTAADRLRSQVAEQQSRILFINQAKPMKEMIPGCGLH